jgi:hypothetical protein
MMEAWHVLRTMRLPELMAYAALSALRLAAALDGHPRIAPRARRDVYLVRDDDRRPR